jgi:hypothetical protein
LPRWYSEQEKWQINISLFSSLHLQTRRGYTEIDNLRKDIHLTNCPFMCVNWHRPTPVVLYGSMGSYFFFFTYPPPLPTSTLISHPRRSKRRILEHSRHISGDLRPSFMYQYSDLSMWER